MRGIRQRKRWKCGTAPGMLVLHSEGVLHVCRWTNATLPFALRLAKYGAIDAIKKDPH